MNLLQWIEKDLADLERESKAVDDPTLPPEDMLIRLTRRNWVYQKIECYAPDNLKWLASIVRRLYNMRCQGGCYAHAGLEVLVCGPCQVRNWVDTEAHDGRAPTAGRPDSVSPPLPEDWLDPVADHGPGE